MPNYKITLTRTWVETDTLERVIAADSAEAAGAEALRMSYEFNRSCPDDVVTSKTGEAGDWGIEDVETTDEPIDETEEGCATCAASIETRPLPCDECGSLDEEA